MIFRLSCEALWCEAMKAGSRGFPIHGCFYWEAVTGCAHGKGPILSVVLASKAFR